MRKGWQLFFLLIFSACSQPEPDLQSEIFNRPSGEIEPNIAQLNPELNFLRIKIGDQVRSGIAYVPSKPLKFPSFSGDKIRFFYGIIPRYFTRYQARVELQVLAQTEQGEKVIWSQSLGPEKMPSWKLAEIDLGGNPGPLIFQSNIKDYGLVITPPREPKAQTNGRPSIIFILIDALRADHLGAYGYPKATSPNLDQLASSGAIFMNAMTASPFTVTSLTSMFTGLYPWQHRALFTHNLILSQELILLAQKLKSAGYQTAGFSATYFHLSDFGLDRGFELFDEGCDARFFDRDAECLTARALNWLKEESEAPFFLYFHYVSTHSPYLPPEPYQKLFASGLDKPKGPVGMGDIHPFGDNRKWYEIPRAPKKNELDWLIAQYDGEIRYVDSEIGKLLSRLTELGLKDQTLILITADHGEAFFEHKKMDHTEELHWQVARIPLILSGPGIPSGRKITELVRSIDFAPFLLEYAQAEPLANISGKSLSPLLFGTESEKRIGFSLRDRTRKKYQIGIIKYPYHFLILKPKDKIEIYDLSSDPEERNNLALKMSELKEEFLQMVPGENLIQYNKGKPGAKLSSELKRRLKALGYIK